MGEIDIARLPVWAIKKLKKGKVSSTRSVVVPNDKQCARGKLYTERALQIESQRVRNAPMHQRNDTLNKASFRIGQLVAHGVLDRRTVEAELNSAALTCGLTEVESTPTIKSGIDAGSKHPRRLPFIPSKSRTKSSTLTQVLSSLGETDADNALRFVRRFGDKVMWTPGGGWYVYNGSFWEPDELGNRTALAIKTVTAIKSEAQYIAWSKAKINRKKFAKKSKSNAAIQTMLQLAQHELAVKDDQLDADPFLLNVSNGTLDLKLGVLREHNPGDLMTRCLNVAYKKKAKSPLFRKFLKDISGGNKDFERFLKKAVGYTLTGSVREQVLFFLLGPGDTGKSTLINLIRAMLKQYAVHVPTKTFLVKQFNNEIPVDEARMKGARMVTAIENNPNQQLDEAKVKAMTGGDRMTARLMRQNPFEFDPEFKLWIAANDLPKVRATDSSIWDRFIVLPFTHQKEESDQDKDLPTKLRGEFEAILAWSVRGTKLWLKEGLADKILFDGAKASWRKQSGTVLQFYQECCQAAPPSEVVQASVMFDRYKQWCLAAGEKPSSDRVFKGAMIELNVAPKKDREANWWQGVKLVK